MNKEELAKILDDAFLNAEPVEQLSLTTPFSEEEAYEIQDELMKRRYKRGEKFVGLKMGFTSKAKMQQMGVNDLIFGRLTDKMMIQNGGDLFISDYIHPRAEPEICFITKKEITTAVPMEEIKEYIQGIAPAIEIIDSRYENFKFSLQDVIADNCSSAAFVVGEMKSVDIPLHNLKMDLKFEYEPMEEGTSNAILGNPWESVVAATRLASKYGQTIPAGSYILAGAATSAIFLRKNENVLSTVDSLGSVHFNVED